MRFHRLFVLAAYGSLAIVLIAVLCPTAKGQSQHLVSLHPPMGWNSWNHFSDKVTDSDVRAAADAADWVSAIDQLHCPRSDRRPFPTFQCQPRFSCRLRRDVDPCSQKPR
jgi:hypothetical protein